MSQRARQVRAVLPGKRLVDGAGMRVKRLIGHAGLPVLDPFVLVDEYKSDDPAEALGGFPDHPHRGFDLVNLVFDGALDFVDASGHHGTVERDGLQWLTTGSGLIHAELPRHVDGRVRGLQVWLNLGGEEKGAGPVSREFGADEIPGLKINDGGRVRVLAGEFRRVHGPLVGLANDPLLLDITLPPATGMNVPVPRTHAVWAYVLDGQGVFGVTETSTGELVGRGHLMVLGPGDSFRVLASGKGARYVVMAAHPTNEPITRYGPFVMSTADEIYAAIDDFHAGTLVREPTGIE